MKLIYIHVGVIFSPIRFMKLGVIMIALIGGSAFKHFWALLTHSLLDGSTPKSLKIIIFKRHLL